MPTSIVPESPDRLLEQMIMGFRLTQLVHVAAKLGVADHLADGPKSAAELAHSCECHPDALYRTLRALANIGVLTELPQQCFRLTPMGEYLRSSQPGSLRAAASLYGEPWLWSSYGQLMHSVRTGAPAFQHTHDSTFFEYLAGHSHAAQSFNAAMTGFSEREIDAILAAYDFSQLRRVIDVGGGHGRLVTALLEAHPALEATLFDQPGVIESAGELLQPSELGARCTLVGGDFFQAVPGGGDVYLLKSVLHDWDDSAACTILKNCHSAMGPDGRLLLIERVVGEPTERSEAKLFDINMLVTLGGRERTQGEHQALLNGAAFRLTRLITTRSPLSILEAMPL
jgi:hypothetical protein